MNSKIGVTPMIGVNDIASEVFTLADAQQLVTFAESDSNVVSIGMWSVARDNGNSAGAHYASSDSSGLAQTPFEFAGIFHQFDQTRAGAGGGTIVGGVNGGTLIGGVGDDVLIANQTQAAADNAAKTTLDGGGGANALYGGGAYTTFIAGDTNGGYNQIWGGASKMTGVAGYTNNTLSFATAPAGVYVDLVNGHNAYVGSTPGGAWGGSGTFEDSIANVSNVIGSAFGDLIQADKGVDRITGGHGADSLYAGTGASSQDTFVYTAYGDSNVVNGYDTIIGFKIGTDKIDLSALHTDASHLAISTAGASNTLYIETTPGAFNSATDLAMIVNTSATGGVHASDFVF
jgi:Ca2+-binding RTX toxin-like protein